MSTPPAATWQTLQLRVDEGEHLATVTLNRPAQANTLTLQSLDELGACFEHLATLPSVRAVLLTGAGPRFCAGIDLSTLQELLADNSGPTPCEGRRRLALFQGIRRMQESISALERFPFPVVVAIHGACVGGGIDLVCASDIRYAARSAVFSVREVDVAIVADLGTLARLAPLVGEGRARELALTGRNFDGAEAERMGFTSGCFDDAAATLAAARAAAVALAAKSPLAVSGTKTVLLERNKTERNASLEHVAWRNASTLVSADITEALQAMAQRRKPVFARL
jgi:enoyl-CoA hydratase/carnithine racemase